jgi:hypothetical protein
MRVISVDGKVIYNTTRIDRAKYIKGGKYTSEFPYTFIYDDYLFIMNSQAKNVTLYSIFRNPIEAYLMHQNNIGENIQCIKYTDIDVFTPDDVTDIAIEMCAQELIQFFNTMGVEDTRNDSADNPPEKSK